MRSLSPILVGFGGWCLGALVTLAALPTVPIDDQVLAIVSIAPPVAVVVYAGWIRRTAPTGAHVVGDLREAGMTSRCAWCGRHRIGNRWMLVRASLLIDTSRTTHSICEDCVEALRGAGLSR